MLDVDERDRTTAAAAPRAAPPPAREEQERTRQLKAMKRRATGLLVVMAMAFVLVSVLGDDDGLMGYVRAAVEASLVGGLADWFAVTALFRHPLRLPIPHTAVIVERKDQFGETLGRFVQENFLSPDVISERLRSARVVHRAADWLADEANADVVARHASDVAVGLAGRLRDEDVHALIEEELRRGIEAVPLAPTLGRALRLAIDEGRHEELLDAALRGFGRFLDDNRESLRVRMGEELLPRWLPDAIDRRIFNRLFEGVRTLVDAAARDRSHEVRRHMDGWLASLADRLETSPELAERGEQLKQEVLAHPELRRWSSSLWGDLKARLRSQAEDPGSELRHRLAGMVTAAGRRLGDDAALQAQVEDVAERGARYVADNFHDEISGLVSGTIARWDGREAASKLELLLGPDLQWIRINGTVVGGLAGVCIHTVGQLLTA